jgi:predicted DNA-binding transcriptional regulator AlpA
MPIPNNFSTRREIEEHYRIPRSTLYRWIAKGLFPTPIKLGPRMVRWRHADLEKWEQEREAQS